MKKRCVILGIAFSVLLVVLCIIYAYIYSMTIWNEYWGFLSGFVIFSTLFLAEWYFIKAGIVPKWIKYCMYYRWGAAAIVFLITMVYLVVNAFL